MATEFQAAIDKLIDDVVKTGELKVDKHVTCNIPLYALHHKMKHRKTP